MILLSLSDIYSTNYISCRYSNYIIFHQFGKIVGDSIYFSLDLFKFSVEIFDSIELFINSYLIFIVLFLTGNIVKDKGGSGLINLRGCSFRDGLICMPSNFPIRGGGILERLH